MLVERGLGLLLFWIPGTRARRGFEVGRRPATISPYFGASYELGSRTCSDGPEHLLIDTAFP